MIIQISINKPTLLQVIAIMYSDSNLSFSVFTLHVSPEYTNVSLDLHLKNKCFIINHGIQGSIHISNFPIQYSYLLKALSLQ